MKDSKKRSKLRQDVIRKELLLIMSKLITVDEGVQEKIIGCWADGYITGLGHYKHRLDLHNKSMFGNIYDRIKMIEAKYK